ncbi:MAG: hypothetical protein J7503_13065 [Cellulomonas iranensis]|uniref:alpha/beta hydrolase n=1 Tax=Cellulomonas iranensis TaxID=76862 RepID=UPI001B03FEB3|nr:hypothetical protein [Cellulomonas iranensis]MBO9569740.1 hypothetical protein [Cellulomonas iranensis]
MRLHPTPRSTRPPAARRAPALVGTATLALGLLTACSSGTGPAPGDVTTPTVLESPPVEMTATEPPACLTDGIAYAEVGTGMAASRVAWAGSGPRGVLLAPQVRGDVCQWSAELVRLAGEGYLVATYDWGASGEVGLRAALDVLRTTGAQDVALVGASAGGTLAAGLADDLGAVAVVALSPPSENGGVDARAASNDFTGPLQVFSSTDDPQVPAADSALVARQDASSVVTEVPGTAHGIELLAPDNPHADHVRATIDTALEQGFATGATG